MKALPALLAAFVLTGCDMDKLTGVQSQEPTPVPRPAATPKPTPKPGEWMLKDYKNPLDKKK